ncbi:MAG TPA: hypothetical protein VHG91_17715 [Longimicrobium sp.]|nr:hypothetical protein [Longimicrobium sp.]
MRRFRWKPARAVGLRWLAMALLLGGLVSVFPFAGEAQNVVDLRNGMSGELDQRMHAFLQAVGQSADSAAAYFPSGGDWTYAHTSHRDDGDRVEVWRFPASQAQQAIRRGPLRRVFSIDYHAQPVGLFAHQVMHRGTEWRRVRGNRYVPPGASASSPVFVEWRREGDAWVVSSLGDESFPNGRLPSWCC